MLVLGLDTDKHVSRSDPDDISPSFYQDMVQKWGRQSIETIVRDLEYRVYFYSLDIEVKMPHSQL